MPETIVREFAINFDSDGHPNGSLNEYHVGKIRQGDNLINRVKVTFAASMSPTQVQLHCMRPDGSITPDTELMTFSNGDSSFLLSPPLCQVVILALMPNNLSLTY